MKQGLSLTAAGVTVALVSFLPGGPAQADPGPPSVEAAAFRPIDTGDRAAVREAVLKRLRPALAAKVKWSGSVSGCVAGKPARSTQQATLKAVNFFRAMAQLDPVTFDAGLSAKAQKAALMMDAENSLNHFPPRSWKCWSKAGAEAAGRSNLCLDCTGAASVLEYMTDEGPGNTAAGHRRWLLFPFVGEMGSGITSGAGALWVIPGERVRAKSPAWVSWPTPGYFPNELDPAGRWSLSASNEKIDFARAKVSVRTADGKALEVRRHKPIAHGRPNYGSPALVWQVTGFALPTGTRSRRLDVTVSGIRVWNQADTALTKKKITKKYSVRYFDADVA
ncbi:CAP domain-containing protein [Kineosporia rhizophila]|uniref:CAP domain-containing protein n=1 Tax=Kineosporia rhizophila TaxID=84633 RepID=UPI001E2CE0B2|nr:CAP domain-containing protein [Kineosporia rhizophila]MCE0534708.1 CAP domain-containing protein [Kineosporia rhizophila]